MAGFGENLSEDTLKIIANVGKLYPFIKSEVDAKSILELLRKTDISNLEQEDHLNHYLSSNPINARTLVNVLCNFADLIELPAKSSLSKGRKLGVEARQKKAANNAIRLNKAIDDLFDAPDKPGWNWSNKEITNFLTRYVGISYYAENSIMQKVKIRVASHRKRRKVEQASKYPI